jgi:hypothetical protein
MPRYPGTGRRPQQAATDDRGDYNIADLRPGTYVVGARIPAVITAGPMGAETEDAPAVDADAAALRAHTPVLQLGEWLLQAPFTIASARLPRTPSGEALMIVPPVYYQAARHPAEGTVLALRPGQNLAGISMTLAPERAYAIRGVLREEGRPKPGFQVAAFLGRLEPGHAGPAVQLASATTDRLGRFFLAGIPSGTVRVVAVQPRPRVVTELPSVLMWAETEVQTIDGDVDDVDLTLAALPPFEAAISVVGESREPLPMRSVTMTLEPDLAGTPVGPGLVRVSADNDGRFGLSHLVPGDYAFRLTLPRGWAVLEISVNGTPVAGRTLHRPAVVPSAIRISLTSQLGSALVAVRQPVGAANESSTVVLLFPARRDLWTAAPHDVDRLRLGRVGAGGRADFDHVLPGDYLVAALSANHPGVDWRNRQTLERLALHAMAMTVVPGRQAIGSVSVSPQ